MGPAASASMAGPGGGQVRGGLVCGRGLGWGAPARAQQRAHTVDSACLLPAASPESRPPCHCRPPAASRPPPLRASLTRASGGMRAGCSRMDRSRLDRSTMESRSSLPRCCCCAPSASPASCSAAAGAAAAPSPAASASSPARQGRRTRQQHSQDAEPCRPAAGVRPSATGPANCRQAAGRTARSGALF